jgi:hypothetical protein
MQKSAWGTLYYFTLKIYFVHIWKTDTCLEHPWKAFQIFPMWESTSVLQTWDCSCRSQTHFQFLVKNAIAPVNLRSTSGTFCIARHDKHWGEISKQSHLYDLLQKLLTWSTNGLLACKNKCVKLVLWKAQNGLHLGVEEFDPSNCTCI